MRYLASPYTHAERITRAHRACHAALYTGHAMGHGDVIYSPVVHGHAIDCHAAVTLEQSKDHAFWMRHCYGMLAGAKDMAILPLDGWRESKGVWLEIEHAKSLGIKICVVQCVPSYLSHAVEILDQEEITAMQWEVI